MAGTESWRGGGRPPGASAPKQSSPVLPGRRGIMSPMSRENRRRAAERGELRAAPRPPERRPAVSRASAPQAEVAGERHISWRHCLIGWVVGEGVLLLLTNGALDAA